MLDRKTVFLAKTETTYGTDAAPTVGSNAIRCESMTVTPEVESLDRKFYDLTFGNNAPVAGMKSISFDATGVEIKGSGTAGTAPEMGVLLMGAGLDETISAGVSVTYQPETDSKDQSMTCWGYKDSILHKGTGCFAESAVLKFEAGQFGKADFTGIKGKTVAETEATAGTPTFNSTKPPIVCNTTFTLGGYAHITRSVEITVPNQLFTETSMTADGCVEGTQITGRDISIKITGAFPKLSTEDMWADFKAKTELALNMVIGATAGNILTITAPKVVVTELAYTDNNGLIDFDLTGILAKNAGDDELVMVFT